MRKSLLVILIFAPLFLVSRAQAGKAGDGVCEEAADRYCWNVEPGHGRVWQCLKKYEADLNAACRRQVEEHTARADRTEDLQKACKSDRKKYCRYVDWADSRVTKCLRIHEVELSEKCRASLITGD